MKNILLFVLLAVMLTGCLSVSEHEIVGTSVANLVQVWETHYPDILETPTTTVPTLTNTPTLTSTPKATDTPISNAYHVYPGESIQEAVNSLAAGDMLFIHEGVYDYQRAYISVSGVTIKGYGAVIDGHYATVQTWGALLHIAGNDNLVEGIEVRNSDYMGVILSGKNNTVSYINSHHHKENGILITGDYGIVENSQVWSNCMSNVDGSRTRGGWASGLSAARHPNNAVIRNNIVWGNWGEGLSTYEANGTIIEDNIVYDNFSANIYISDATNVIVKGNLVYITQDPTVKIGSRAGIMLGDEKYNPPSANIQILNNTVRNTSRNLYWWRGLQGGGLVDVLISDNVFSDAWYFANIQISEGNHERVTFQNNIIEQDNTLILDAYISDCSQIVFSGNTWANNPPCEEQ